VGLGRITIRSLFDIAYKKNRVLEVDTKRLHPSQALETLTENQNSKAAYNNFIQPTGNNAFSFSVSGLWPGG
jgi:hypothetical protein